MKENKYFDAETLKEDLRDEVIAEIRDNLDEATKQLLYNVVREQEMQSERISEIGKIFAIFSALLLTLSFAVNVFLVRKVLAHHAEIEKMEERISVIRSDVSTNNKEISGFRQTINNIKREIDFIFEAEELGVLVEPYDDSGAGTKSKYTPTPTPTPELTPTTTPTPYREDDNLGKDPIAKKASD